MELSQVIPVIVIILIVAIFVLIEIKKRGIQQLAIDLMVEAEKKFKSGEGRKKMNQVVKKLIDKLPFPLNMIPESIVEDFVQKIFDDLKESIEAQK